MAKKYQAIDVANYILWYANEKHAGEMVTALKLHKLVYYVAALYGFKYGDYLFDEKIEKWQYGPVTPSVYHTFKGRGYNHISGPEIQFEITDSGIDFMEFNKDAIDNEHQILFNKIIDKLIEKTAGMLVEMTHEENAWDKYKKEIYQGKRNLEYDLEELKEAINYHKLAV